MTPEQPTTIDCFLVEQILSNLTSFNKVRKSGTLSQYQLLFYLVFFTHLSNILNKRLSPPPPPPLSTVPPPEVLVSMFFKWADPSSTYQGFACLPNISGLTEPLTRLLHKNDICVVNKPLKTLQQEFPSPKFRQPSDLQCNVVYKIPCRLSSELRRRNRKMLPNPQKGTSTELEELF